jgi:Fic family protein
METLNIQQQINSMAPEPLSKIGDLQFEVLSPKLTNLLIQARANIALLNGYCIALPNPFLLLSPAIIKESLASNDIENIQTTLIEALQSALYSEPERSQPDKEVLRYREAMMWGFDEVKTDLPIVSRLITGIQKKLIPSDGNFRNVQNAIWNPNSKEIIHLPPSAKDIPDLIKDWEIFVNSETKIDPLIKIAIAHYQFESIHPFKDGNGRTGRILMVLDLAKKDLLSLPILYLSGYISTNKTRYYEVLQSVRKTNSWDEYLEFMLTAFANQAKLTADIFKKIMSLLNQQKQEFKTKIPKIYSREILEGLFSNPVLSPVSLGGRLGIHYTTASKYLKELEKIGLLKTAKVGKHQFYMNYKLIDILI